MICRTIVAKELREVVRDRRLCAAIALVPLTLLGLLTLAWFESAEAGATQRRDSAEARRNWLEQGERDPHGAAHHGTYLYKYRPPLSYFDAGLDPFLGTTLRIEAHHQHRLANRPSQDGTSPLRFVASTPATVLQIVLPLMIILVGYSAVTRERERGTLPMVLGLGVPARTLILGKALAVLLVATVLAAPAVAFLAWALAAADGEAAGFVGDVAARGGMIGACTVLYLAGWAFLTLAISARMRSSRSALVSLVGAWAAWSLILPYLATDLSRRLHPLPSQEEFDEWISRSQSNSAGESRFVRARKDLEARLLKQYAVRRVEDLPVNFEGIWLQQGEELGNELNEEAEAKLDAILDRQDRVVGAFTALSPFLAIRAASMGLAGSDRAHHDAFGRQAEAYRRDLVKLLNGAIAARPAGVEADRSGRDLWEKVPEFRYRAPGWRLAARRSAPSLALLSAWCGLAVGLAVGLRSGIRVGD